MTLRREILRLALPSILANLTVPLVGMVDLAVAGHLPGGSAAALIGGVSIGSMLFDLLYWNFAFLRTGTGGLTAQTYGELRAAGALDTGHIPDALGAILGRALRIALLSGAALIALQWVVVKLAFLVVTCSPEVQALATRYFYLRIWAAPATLALFAFKGWFIGLQDSVRPMTADLLVNGLNIGLSIGLGLELGFPGIALGTVIAQWTGLGYCLLAALRRYRAFSIRPKLLITRLFQNPIGASGADKMFHALNRDLFLRSVGMIAVYIGFTVISARFGDLMLAVSAILMKFLMVFSYFTDGFAYAGEALTGRFIGERSATGLRTAVRETFAMALGVAALFMGVYAAAGVPLLRLMTPDAAVIQAGEQFLPWLLLMPLVGCPAFTWDGIFIGATAGADLRNSTLLCAVGFFGVWLAGRALQGPDTSPEAAIHLLMGAYFVHLAIRALYLSLRSRAAIFSGISSR